MPRSRFAKSGIPPLGLEYLDATKLRPQRKPFKPFAVLSLLKESSEINLLLLGKDPLRLTRYKCRIGSLSMLLLPSLFHIFDTLHNFEETFDDNYYNNTCTETMDVEHLNFDPF